MPTNEITMSPTASSLIFGLDIGIASVGWAVLSPERIVDLGVRAFDKAETAKEGDSLNLVRRTARLLRRRLWRRAWRLTKLDELPLYLGDARQCTALVARDKRLLRLPLQLPPDGTTMRLAPQDAAPLSAWLGGA